MSFLLLHLCAGLLLVEVVRGTSRCVEIVDAGVEPVIRGHIGIQFFVTVTNKGSDPIDLDVKTVQCCEDFPDGLSDCNHIHLIPESRTMSTNSTVNFTLVHPTLYPYNRKGECLLGIRYSTSCNRSKEARQHIAFDTSLTEENVRKGMLRGFPKSAVEGRPCQSVDEDILDGCRMVDCHLKYFGLRSFFNKGTRMCEPVPPCLSTRRRVAPDVVYDVTTNTCRNLSTSLSPEDLQHFSHTDLEPECGSHGNNRGAAFLNCHYGQLCNASSDCRCPPEYVKAEVPQEPGSPRTQVFHSCNVVGSCWHVQRFLELPSNSVMVTAFLLSLVVVLSTVCMIQQG